MYNYQELAQLIPELSDHLKNDTLNYSDPVALRLLNRALLLKEFNLTVDLPAGHLCPTIPNRTAYINQIEFLIKHIFKLSVTDSITGIDIGTGASCVYPLIACARNSSWNFIGTDIDDEIINFATSNVNLNPFISERIQIVKNSTPTSIFPSNLKTLLSTITSPTFVITNPPFYTDSVDLATRRAFKRHKSNSGRFEMTSGELGTELGGEVGFIKQMIKESLELDSNNIFLFSCMLGMKESLNELLEHLKTFQQIKSFAFQVLQIKHTTRYLLFWSLSHPIPVDKDYKLKITAKGKRVQTITVPAAFDFRIFCNELQTKYTDNSTQPLEHNLYTDTFTINLTHNRWNRKSRRSGQPPILLTNPIEVLFTIQNNETNTELVSVPDSQADWDTFLGFVNHLRKEVELERKK